MHISYTTRPKTAKEQKKSTKMREVNWASLVFFKYHPPAPISVCLPTACVSPSLPLCFRCNQPSSVSSLNAGSTHTQTPSTHQGVISLCLHCQGVIWLSVRVWHRQRYTVKDSLSTLQTSRFCIQCIYHVSLHWQYVMPYNHTICSERQDLSICQGGKYNWRIAIGCGSTCQFILSFKTGC